MYDLSTTQAREARLVPDENLAREIEYAEREVKAKRLSPGWLSALRAERKRRHTARKAERVQRRRVAPTNA